MGAHAAPRVPETWATWVAVLLLVAAMGAITGVLTVVGVGWGSPWWALNLVPGVIAYRLFFRDRLPLDPIGGGPGA